eukprot:NODE_593_length_1940_cov_8.813326_g474_i0.p1 GENE.NODE_593_length_1940_cov_8.813326_g474_i0~~NODE_593_length_1940_cov_8.813326_g474_i0.p1  ORF type:complete len:611 (+),score=165.23 NODE_593_length_1940_cov_8.813326_g474_i0:225-1835(+)
MVTSEPHPSFPIGLLQMSLKVTNEPPQGLQAGMKRCYSWLGQDVLDNFRRPEWRPMLFSLCFLHSIVVERRRFGAIGWNVPYEFNQGDWMASLGFFTAHFTSIGDDLKKGAAVSWETVTYMVSEIQYGGRITDDKDRVLFNAVCTSVLGAHIVQPSYAFSPGYVIPTGEDITKHRQYLEELPAVDAPEVFGLHPNAEVSYRTTQAVTTLATILDIQPRSSNVSSGPSREDQVLKAAEDLLKKLPADWKRETTVNPQLQKIGAKMPLNIFLSQEIDRLQAVIGRVRRSLTDLKLAIAGTIIMSQTLQEILDFLYDARAPPAWVAASWPSLTLGSWFAMLVKRHEQLNSWLMQDRPSKYWLTGFFNPQGFLTSVRQEVTRAHAKESWALDEVETKTEVQRFEKHESDRAPHEGVYIYGMYLEGASWDKLKQKIKESANKEMFREIPLVHVTAVPIGQSIQPAAAPGRGQQVSHLCLLYFPCKPGLSLNFTRPPPVQPRSSSVLCTSFTSGQTSTGFLTWICTARRTPRTGFSGVPLFF